VSLSDLEKRAILRPVDAELDRQKEKAAKFKKAYHELLDAVKVSHVTGFWGPVEDAYAASGRPALKHRENKEEAQHVCVFDSSYQEGNVTGVPDTIYTCKCGKTSR
jgi:hypothetical protein